MKRFVPVTSLVGLIALICLPLSAVFSQSFNNGDLNGTVGTSVAPTGWAQVPHTDPNSIANQAISATSDVCNTTGPSMGGGIHGNPYSGSTFTCGLKGTSTWGYDYHEGLQQTVSGFTPGNSYTISLRQAVVKQSNALDMSGGWQIAVDNTIIGFTAPSFSTLGYSSNSLRWDLRSISFTATSVTHTIKFLPNDDDNNFSLGASVQGAVRMGIDSVNLSNAAVLDLEVALEGYKQGSGVMLNWKLGPEDQVNQVVVERSRDGFIFEDLRDVAMNPSGKFAEEDPQPYPQTYYRLRLLTQGGNTYYSNILYLEASEDLQAWMQGDQLYLRGGNGAYPVRILDLRGAEIFRGELASQNDLGHLPAGAYVLAVSPVKNGQKPLNQKILLLH